MDSLAIIPTPAGEPCVGGGDPAPPVSFTKLSRNDWFKRCWNEGETGFGIAGELGADMPPSHCPPSHCASQLTITPAFALPIDESQIVDAATAMLKTHLSRTTSIG